MDETPTLQFPFPESTDSPDGPAQLEALALAVEEATIAATPVGSIRATIKGTADSGWLVCDGSSVAKATYPALNTILSAASYPFGSTATHFSLPDLRGRIPVGVGTHADVNALGDNDGAALADRRVNHSHADGTLAAASHTHADGTLATASHTHEAGSLAAASHTHGPGSLTVAAHSHGDGTLSVDAHSHTGGSMVAAAHTHGDGTLTVASHTHADGTLAAASHTHGIFFNTSALDGLHYIGATSGGPSNVIPDSDHIHLVSGNTGGTAAHDVSGSTSAAAPDVSGATAASSTIAVTGSTDTATAGVSGSTATATSTVDGGVTAGSAADVAGDTAGATADVTGSTSSSAADVTGSTGEDGASYLALYFQIKV